MCDIIMGQSPSSENYTSNPNDTVLIQGNADLKNGKITPKIFTKEITKKSKLGDIILTVRAPVGSLAINNYEACIGRGVCLIRADNNEFLYYLLKRMKENHTWEKLSQGSTFESINSTDIKQLKIKIPSNEEQEKIANFLSFIDKQIGLLANKYNLYQNFKKGVIQQIFTQKLQFKKVKSFFVSDIITSISSKNYQINKNSIKEIGKFPVIDQGKNRIAGFYSDETKLFNNLPVIIFGDHTTILKYAETPFIVGGDGVKLLKPKININLKYLYYNLIFNNVNSEGYKRHFSIFKKRKLLIHESGEEQEKIANFLSVVDRKIDLINSQIEKMEEFKKGLLQQMFTSMLSLFF